MSCINVLEVHGNIQKRFITYLLILSSNTHKANVASFGYCGIQKTAPNLNKRKDFYNHPRRRLQKKLSSDFRLFEIRSNHVS